MEQLRCAGATVGEYVGNGLGETERTDTEDQCDEDAEPVVDDHHESEEASEGSSDNAHPLLFFFMIVRPLVSVSTVSTSLRLLPRWLVYLCHHSASQHSLAWSKRAGIFPRKVLQ